VVANPDAADLAKAVIASLRYRGEAVRDAKVPLSAIVNLVDATLGTSRFFPADLRPADLGDGAQIERLSAHRYRVHERYETGQLRFSELSARSHFFLRSAVKRYLRHYRALLRVRRVTITGWLF
jgi:hypothetical protein